MLLWLIGCGVLDFGRDATLMSIDSTRPTVPDTGETASTDTGDPDTGDTDTGDTDTDPWIVISDPRSEDADGDGLWEPGESLTVYVMMENMRAEDYMYYPGVLVETDHPGVIVPAPGGGWFYGIFGLDRQELAMQVQAAPEIAAGEQVDLRLILTSLGCDDMPEVCLGDQLLSYSRIIGQ